MTHSNASENALVTAATVVARSSRLLILCTTPLADANGKAKSPHADRGIWRDLKQVGNWRAPVKSREKPQSQWARQRLDMAKHPQPGPAHQAIALLQQAVPTTEVITDATDLLLETAGARHVWHLHGHVPGERCEACGVIRSLRSLVGSGRVRSSGERTARCNACGGASRLWTGSVDAPRQAWSHALQTIRQCDTVLWMADGEFVYPAAELAQVAVVHGANLVMLSAQSTGLDRLPDVRVQGPIAQNLAALTTRVQALRQA